MTKIIDGVKYTNIPDDLYGVGISDTIIQTNIQAAGHSNKGQYLEDTGEEGNYYPLVHAVDIDWDGIKINKDITINNTSDLVSWIRDIRWEESTNTSGDLTLPIDGKFHIIDSSSTNLSNIYFDFNYNASNNSTTDYNNPTEYYIKVPKTFTSVDNEDPSKFFWSAHNVTQYDPDWFIVDLGVSNLSTGNLNLLIIKVKPIRLQIGVMGNTSRDTFVLEYRLTGYKGGLYAPSGMDIEG